MTSAPGQQHPTSRHTTQAPRTDRTTETRATVKPPYRTDNLDPLVAMGTSSHTCTLRANRHRVTRFPPVLAYALCSWQ
ncbi:hypothetical protein [Ktedonobacter racemifer]|uniref:hypothetical protein n=1 Tax=Ktedonobacter racemifer TaxID=363277 RepID=UPI0012F74ED4|nr:hypothetical protein [Ktedonobacter racemifer]